MEPGGSHGLQNRSRPDSVGLGGFDSHALPPLAYRERPLALDSMIARFVLIASTAALSFIAAPALFAQRDSVPRVAAPVTAAVTRAPIGPRRAFFYSFLVPGYSQTILGRNKAAATFAFVEAISLVMIRESAADVNEARRMTNDSIVVSYVDANGAPAITKLPPRFDDRDIRTRRAHIEDWVAFLIANHLFAGADAFVAAHLWDVPARLGLRVAPGRGNTVVAASLKW